MLMSDHAGGHSPSTVLRCEALVRAADQGVSIATRRVQVCSDDEGARWTDLITDSKTGRVPARFGPATRRTQSSMPKYSPAQ